MVRYSLYRSLVLPGIEVSVGSFSDLFLASDFFGGKETSIDLGFDKLWSSGFAFINRTVSELDLELRKLSDFCVEAVLSYGFGFKDVSSIGSCFEAVTLSDVCSEVGTLSDLLFKTISLSEMSFSVSSPTIAVGEEPAIDEEWETSISSLGYRYCIGRRIRHSS